ERIQGVEIRNMRDFDAPRVPIIKHPDVKRMLLTMKARVEGMRALLYRAAYYADLSEAHPDEKVRDRTGKLLELLTPICKAYCSDTGFEMTVLALQTYGGYGYIREYPVEQLMRDAKISSIYEGTNGIQALDLIGRKIPKNNGEYYMLLMDEITKIIEANNAHPALAHLAQCLQKDLDRVRTVTGRFAESGMKGDLDFPTSNATAYLNLLGNTLLGWLLLDQAAIAHDKLSEMLLERGVDSPEARDRLLADNARARYYENKLKTAAFFIENLLPENAGIAECILDGNQEALQVEL
ncbi:MAG TPA: acyl-CoA dehydrogenase, partial [Candidatus Hydrogenedentes bacterium]|nr:acyl-CoA dehydrogenase [Candidatus Hydrogenedentota bacterium]